MLVYGFDEYMARIARAIDGDPFPAIKAAFEAMTDPMVREILWQYEKPRHYITGRTAAAFDRIISHKQDFYRVKLGFNIKKGGLPALWIEYGTPTIAPEFIMYHAMKTYEWTLPDEEEFLTQWIADQGLTGEGKA